MIFCTLNYHFAFFLGPDISKLSKNSIFPRLGAFLFKFPCLVFNSWKISFSGLLKHYKSRGFIFFFLCFCCSKRREGQKKDNWNFWFCFLSTNGHFVTVDSLGIFGLLKLVFLECFFGARSLGQVVNKKDRKFWLITEKLIFGYFCFFLFVLYSFCFCFFLKGQMRWPEGPPHLALTLRICFGFLNFILSFFFFSFSFWRVWATSLGPKPSFFWLVLFCYLFVFVSLWEENLFSPKQSNCYLFFSHPFFLPSFILTPFSLSLSLCLSLSLSLSCDFLSSFLVLFIYCFLLLLCFCLLIICLAFLLLFHEKNNIKQIIGKLFFINQFCFVWFPVLLCLSNPFLLSLHFPYLKVCFFQHQDFYLSKKTTNKTPILDEVGGCNELFLNNLCWQNVKSYCFFGPILAIIWLMFKSTVKIGVSAHF